MSPWLFLAVFLYVFGWRLYSQIDFIQLISAGFALYGLLNHQHPVARTATPVAALFLLALVYSSIVFIARGFTDPVPLLRITRALLTFGGGAGIAIYLVKRYGEAAAGQLLKAAMASVLLHGAIMLAMYVSHPIRTALYGVTGGVQHANRGVFLGVNAADVGIRVMGLTYGLASTSVLQAAATFQLPNLYRHTRTPLLLAPLFALVAIASAAVAGRSGLLLAAMLAPIFLVSILLMKEYRKVGISTALLTLLLIPVLVAAYTGLSSSRSQQLTYTMSHLQELVTIVTSPDRSATLKFLAGQFLLPSGAANLLFGVGSFGRSATFYLASDIGFVQQIFAYGIFGLVLLWAPLFWMLWVAIKHRRASPLGTLGFSLVVVASVIFNGKEESLYERCLWSFQILLWMHVVLAASAKRVRGAA